MEHSSETARGADQASSLSVSDDSTTAGASNHGPCSAFSLRLASVINAASVILIALLGLCGYVPGLEFCGRIREDYIPMAPSTAISFILLGGVLLMLTLKHRPVAAYIALGTLAFLVSLFGALEVVGHFSGQDLNFEDSLVPVAGYLGDIPIARMSPATGAAFVFAGLATLALVLGCSDRTRRIHFRHWAGCLGSLVLVLSFVFCLAYLFGTPLLYGRIATVPMAATTALGFLALGAATVCASGRDAIPLRQWVGPSTFSYLLRVFVPLTASTTLLGGFLVLRATTLLDVNPALVAAATAVLAVAIAAFISSWIAHRVADAITRSEAARDKAIDALRNSEEVHRVILSSISDTVLIADDSGAFSFVCPNVHVVFGYSEDEVATKNVRELLGQNLFDRDRLKAAGELANIERTIRDKSGRYHVLLITIKRVSIGAGTVLYVCRDITERKRAEDALAEERRLGELLLDSLPHSAMLIRRDRTILAANKTARDAGAKVGGLCWQEFRHTKYIPEEDKQYLCEHAAPPPDGTRCTFCLADEALDCRRPTNNPQVHAFGRIWDTHWVPLDDDIFLHYAIDMTERIQTETELRQSEILRAEAEKLAAAGRMAARVAHEINNPLAGIKAAFQVLKKAIPEDYPRYKHVGRIEKEIERIQVIVRQMIHLHRAEREADSNVSIRETVGDVVTMLQPLCRKQEVSVEVDTESCQNVVKLPENGLRQVLYALLINGIEASPKGEVVRVQAVADQRTVQITVADEGAGVPEQLGDRIFEPFFTTKGSEVTGGLGLGLPIARGIVEAWGGTLDFESRPDRGCVFRIVLLRGDVDESSNSNPPGSNPDCG